MDHDEVSGAYAGQTTQQVVNDLLEAAGVDQEAPPAAHEDVWVYEAHSNSTRGHRVTNRRDDSLSFHAANRQSGLHATKLLNDYTRPINSFAERVKLWEGVQPEDIEAQGASLLHDWLEGLRTTMLQARQGLDDIPTSASGQESDWNQVSEAVNGTLEEIDRLIGPIAPAAGDTATSAAGLVSDAAPAS